MLQLKQSTFISTANSNTTICPIDIKVSAGGSQKPVVFFYVKKIFLIYFIYLHITWATEVVRVPKIFFKLLAGYSKGLSKWLH